jgi:hypothetical protein
MMVQGAKIKTRMRAKAAHDDGAANIQHYLNQGGPFYFLLQGSGGGPALWRWHILVLQVLGVWLAGPAVALSFPGDLVWATPVVLLHPSFSDVQAWACPVDPLQNGGNIVLVSATRCSCPSLNQHCILVFGEAVVQHSAKHKLVIPNGVQTGDSQKG